MHEPAPAHSPAPLSGRRVGLSLVMLAASAALVAFAARTDAPPQKPPAEGDGIGNRARDEGAERLDRPEFAGKTAKDAPVRGWFEVLKGVFGRMSEDRVTSIAGGVTFFALLAIFPAIAALVSIYGLFTDPTSLADQLDALSNVLPGGAMEVVGSQLHRIAEHGRTSLGVTFLIGIGTALWSANAGMKALFDALNIVYGEKETRGFFKLNLVSLGFTLAAILLILCALGAVVVLPVVFGYVGLDGQVELALKLGRWPALLVVLSLALAAIYRFGPSRTVARWRWITWGSATASLLWLAASVLFSWYAANFGSYDKTYGTLGAAVGFMTWIWISVIVVLLGAEVDDELEYQDPSVPRQKLGERLAA
ncbi:Ribonuclease BN [Rhodovulum sp. PH10]|uniref:YihY/virulence factor BrkB family protein n=1 Tax=Rhodovulum sp. PH10 TaxID=1187851 RepID=UPI00027C2854|nr:YihY/virulence factor BrkB family protein [Rhodovulum sp. PH10]EJW13622.1 Ribonuclease BN [Rhodovulum sp. PH10]